MVTSSSDPAGAVPQGRPTTRSDQPIRVSVRSALVLSAVDLLAEVGTGVSVQELCEHAGVGVGSMYNHFADKDDLFTAAAGYAIADFEAAMSARTAGMRDPIDRFTANMRLYGRMPDTHPRHARVLTTTAERVLARPEGFNPAARRDIDAVLATGKASCPDVELLLIAAFAAFERLITLRILNPSIGPQRADDLAAFVLTWLGIPQAAARRRIRKPLPEPPPVDSTTPTE